MGLRLEILAVAYLSTWQRVILYDIQEQTMMIQQLTVIYLGMDQLMKMHGNISCM